MKKNLVLIMAVLLLSALYVPAATKMSVVASPLRVTAGEEVKIKVYCVDTDTNYLQKGVTVKFTVAAGGGKLSAASGVSDEKGEVVVTLTTGARSGTNAVKVESSGVQTSYVSVNSEALPPTEFSVKIEPDKIYFNQTASLVVVVKNAKGELFKDAEVKVTPSANLVTAIPAMAKTDAAGTAKFAIKSARTTGAVRIEISAAGLEIKTVDFEVLAPGAKNIETGASSLNIGTRNKTTLTAKIIDTSDEPMAKVPINFQIDSGDATLSANQAITDSKGTCSVELMAGNAAGVVVVKVSSNDFKAVDLKINVSAVILPPAFLSAKANGATIFVGDETTISATVEDKDRRLINGATVKFERVTGGGTLLSPSGTTESGKASTIFTAGLAPGKTILKITCGTLPPAIVTITTETSVGASADEKAGKAEKIFLTTDNKNPGILSRPAIIALVTDASNIPVAGAEVKFLAEKGSIESTVKTDENGEAITQFSYFGLGKIRVDAGSEGQSENIQLLYKIPEWVYLFPSVVLFLIVFMFYFMRAGGLKKKLISAYGALNSDLFVKNRVRELLAHKKNFAACFIDIDEFKNYNSAAGFVRGDKVIAELAGIVRKHVPLSEIAAHLGGDDFVYICEPKKAKNIADKISAEFDSKLLNYYSEDDYKNGFITIRHTDGMLFNYPLMKLSIAIAEPEKAAAKTYNELFEFGGRLLKSAKAKKEGKVVDDFDDEAERGPKKVKIGWFTVGGAFLLLLSLPVFLNAEVDISKKMKLSAVPESAGIGQSVKLKARLTDNRDRPISGAFLLFEDLNKGDGIGGFSHAGVRTDKDGNAEVLYKVGEKIGRAMVKVSFKGDRAVSTGLITVHVNYLRYIFMLVGLVFLVFTILYVLKALKLGPLFQGIDTETGMRTRIAAENRLRVLFKANIRFQMLFIDYRNFTGFNREYGYADGQKAAKAIGDQLKSIVKEFAPREGEAFSYGEDKFVVITKKAGEEIAKNIIEEMEIHIPLLCQDKNANYYLLHLTVAMIEVDPAKVKSIGEIMQIAGQLVSDAKTKPGSALLKG